MENYYNTLPDNYKVAKVVDAKDAKVGIIMNLIGLLMMALVGVPLYFIRANDITSYLASLKDNFLGPYLILMLSIFGGYIIYIILHELTHGIAYKITTKQKLTFGFNGFVAFCGVPKIYTSRKTSLIALLAPFITYTLILLPMCFMFKDGMITLVAIFLFSAHFGGCVGDLYCTILLLFKFDKNTLVNDTGPMQVFYILKE